MSILARALAGATLVVALALPAAAQSVPSGAIPAATVTKGGDRHYDVFMFHDSKWKSIQENVAASNPRWAIVNTFKGGYASIPYEGVSRGYRVKQRFTNLRAYLIERPRPGEARNTYHCNLQFGSLSGCKN